MQLTPGARVGPYEIIAPLGAGGMGEVHRARDARLGRDIALKVLPHGVASSPERLARFEREARTVAGLNHPNIVTLHSIEEVDGTRFITMELVEGRDLGALIVPGGVPLDQLLDLAIPLADALVAAHEKGVVHRDLKPANVMRTRDGRIKVLDFGLAKLTEAGPDLDGTQAATLATPISEVGQVMGTAPYMAPEQLRGEAVDARTDLFAFGILVYELSTGRRPFGGRTFADVSSAILRDTPEPLTRVRSDLPADLERIVGRCLDKQPRARFQTALDVANELRGLARWRERGAPPVPTRTPDAVASIAVLPFVNRSGSADDEYFSDGIADELLNALARIKRLRVTARSSSFHFKGKDATIAEIARALDVSTVLEGSVRKAGNRVRIGVQLVRAADSSQLWSETYDRSLDDIFAVQDDIARSVAKELSATLLGDAAGEPVTGEPRAETATASHERPCDPESYDLYLRGRYLFGAAADGPVRAQELFRQAIERSPRFALAYAGLGESYVMQTWLGSRDREITVAQAKGALARALALDDGLVEARVLAAQIAFYFDWDWAGAEQEYRRAVELHPGSDLAHREQGVFLSCMGRFEDGLAAARRAQALDPLSVNATHEVGYELLTMGRLEEAAREFLKAIDLNPTWIWGNVKLGMTYSRMDDHDRAMACVRRADELLGDRPGTPLLQSWLAVIEFAAAKPERLTATRRRLEEQSRTAYVDPLVLVWFACVEGDHDAVFAYLDAGYEARSPLMVFLLQLRHFLWRDVADDARYDRLLRRMGLVGADS